MTWEPQHLCIMIKPRADGRIVMEFSSLEQGAAVWRIDLTAQEWEHFKDIGDQQMRAAQRHA